MIIARCEIVVNFAWIAFVYQIKKFSAEWAVLLDKSKEEFGGNNALESELSRRQGLAAQIFHSFWKIDSRFTCIVTDN